MKRVRPLRLSLGFGYFVEREPAQAAPCPDLLCRATERFFFAQGPEAKRERGLPPVKRKPFAGAAMLARNAEPVSIWQSRQWHTFTVPGSTSAS